MIVIYICTDPFLDCLQLRKDFLWFEARNYLGHLIDRVEEMSLDL